MSAHTIAAELLGAAAIVAIVGDRRALAQLPQGTDTMPALVYEIVDSVPVLPINAADGPQLMLSRIQVTGLAMDPADLEALQAAVRSALHLQSGTIAGHHVAAVVRDIETSITRDNARGVWYGSQDFIATWYD